MKSLSVQTAKLLVLTLLLISPLIIASCFFPAQSSATSSVPITPVEFPHLPPESSRPSESQFALLMAEETGQKVLGAKIEKEEVVETEATSALTGTYTIAVLGDSMVDVLQPEMPQLASALKKFYPQAQFKLLNYGVGASDIEYGLTRLTAGYTYLGKTFPSLLSQNPDIIVIESFAYNHWANSQSELDHYWLTLGNLTSVIKAQSQAKIVLAATIAPDVNTLCDGIDGISLSPDQKWAKANNIKAYLENLINFASSQGYPLADAYHASLDSSGNGQAVYVNAGDHLHPSGPGGELFSQKVAEAIFKNNLL
jgi:hypothetical protein